MDGGEPELSCYAALFSHLGVLMRLFEIRGVWSNFGHGIRNSQRGGMEGSGKQVAGILS